MELTKINSLSLNWRIVHKIEDSPFFGFAKEDFHDAETDIEIMVQIRAFDEVLQTPWFRKLPILILK